MLKADADRTVLQSGLELAAHFSMKLKERWQCCVKGHDVVVEKQRPLLLAGFRRQTYRIFFDGTLVLERKGF